MKLKVSELLQKINCFENNVTKLQHTIFYGHLIGVSGLILTVIGLNAPIGAQCFVEREINGEILDYCCAKVVGFKGKKTLLFSFEEMHGIIPGARVFLKLSKNIHNIFNKIPLGMELLGRVLDGKGNPLDKKSALHLKNFIIFKRKTINPLDRIPIHKILDTGIRAVNGLMTIGRGQRIGIFSSSGVGKSILLGMMARYTYADIIIIALIGERGREVKDFIQNILGTDGLSRSVVIASPADASPIDQIEAALYATTIAEYFCQKNKHVLLIMDSLTRYAMAQREISLSLGELPISKGYPVSVFSKIPTLIERTGNIKENGSITAFYTILTENEEDQQDPISHLCRSILDGHIVLSRYYSDAGHYPAIDLESSISRVMPDIVSHKQYNQACYFKKLVSIYQRNRDLINIGAYVSGSNPILDQAIKIWPLLEKFLQQKQLEKSDYYQSYQALEKIFI